MRPRIKKKKKATKFHCDVLVRMLHSKSERNHFCKHLRLNNIYSEMSEVTHYMYPTYTIACCLKHIIL